MRPVSPLWAKITLLKALRSGVEFTFLLVERLLKGCAIKHGWEKTTHAPANGITKLPMETIDLYLGHTDMR